MKPNDIPGSDTVHLTNEQLRSALGSFTTGIAIVTTLTPEGDPVGLTVNSFNSVSMDPPLILWSLGLQSPNLVAFRTHPSFIVNILSQSQHDLCRKFAMSGADKFLGIQWQAGLHGAPVLPDNVATLHCLNYRQYAGGDHEIFLGEVTSVTVSHKVPLIYQRGQLGQFNALS